MERNYFCNEQWFDTYESARAYAESATLSTRKYHVVFTRAEMDSMVRDMVESVISHAEHVLDCPSIDGFGCHCEDIIDHEMECGK